MSEVRLTRYEAENGNLPAICLRCGSPASERVTKTFKWKPSWVIALLLMAVVPYLIVSFILEKRCRIIAPFCAQHRNHWSFRNWLVGGVLLAVVLLGICAVVILDNTRGTPLHDLGGLLCAATSFGLFAWFILAAVLGETAVQPTEITEDTISLKGVSLDFAQAVNQRRGTAPQAGFHDDVGKPFDYRGGRPDDQYRGPDHPR